MKPIIGFSLKTSIATRILFVVLGLYLLIASTVALGQILVNFKYQKANILQDLNDIEVAFEEGLAFSLWNMDKKALEASVKGMMKIPTIVGVTITNVEKETIVVSGVITDQSRSGRVGFHVSLLGLTDEEKTINKNELYKFELFEHHFPIIYNNKGRSSLQGQVIFFSSNSVIYRRMKVEFVMVAVSVGVTLIVFFFALLWTVNRYLRRPLGILTKATANISLDSLGEFSVDTRAFEHNEIKQLEETMTTMVSELHEAVSKQRKSEELYRSLFDDNPSMYFKISEDGIVLSVNQFGAEQLGYTIDELVGESVLNVFHPDDRVTVQKRLAKCLEHPRQVAYWEFRKIRKNGSVMWVKENVRVVEEKNGEKVVLVVCDDITERKETALALSKSEKKYRTLFQKTSDAIFIIDRKTGKFLDANEAALKLTGRNWPELSKLTTLEISPQGAANRLKKIEGIKTTQKLGQAVYIRSNGEKRTAMLIAIPLSNDTIIGIARDITEELILNERLRQSQKMEAIGTLAGGIAHDFNNILSGIFGYSQLVKMNIDDPEKTNKNIDQVIKGAQKATDLVKQILTFSRKSEHKMLPLKIFTEVKEAIKLLRSSIPTTIEIKENIASRATILADLTQIHQVVMNLCTNAYHAMREKGGVLSISLENTQISNTNSISDFDILPGTYLKLEVSDTGPGISPEALEKIYEPYFTTKQHGQGTGLGLAVVLGIVEEHNGYIKVHSEIGKGSTFHVYFPVLEDNIDSNLMGKEKNTKQGGTEKIMVVDDEIDILSSTKELLENHGYTIMVFSDGEQAFKEFKKNPQQIDLIITDMSMPKMTGEELSCKILKIRNDLPILLCTGYSENLTEEKALEIGIKKFIQKPVESDSLLALIREVLDKN